MKRVISIVIWASLYMPVVIALDTIYVDVSALGPTQTGESWQTAYRSLDLALLFAEYGDQIWIAKGIYTPIGINRESCFHVQAGIALFGGFQGWEGTLGQRQIGQHPTILSGDRGATGNTADNCFNVVYYSMADSLNIIDGFTISHGNANNDNPYEHFTSRTKNGGGIYVTSADASAAILIRNCTFLNNSSEFAGGAVFVGSDKTIAPRFESCVFEKNTTGGYGGGVAFYEGLSTTGKVLFNCTFLENLSASGGGVMIYGSLTEEFTIAQCQFELNTSHSGSGIHFVNPRKSLRQITITDCNFVRNNLENLDADASLSISGTVISGIDTVCITKCNFIQTRQLHPDAGGASGIKIGTSMHVIVDECTFDGDRISVTNRVTVINDVLTGTGSFGLINSSIFNTPNDFLTHAVYSNCDKITITNSKLYGNNASVQCQLGSCTVLNSLFSGNNASILSGGKPGLISAGKKMEIINSILRNNSSNALFSDSVSLSNVITDQNKFDSLMFFKGNSLVPALQQELNEIQYETNPFFIDEDEKDFRVISCSPAVNSGTNVAIGNAGLERDFEGNDRIVDQIVDIGPYEHPTPFKLKVENIMDVQCFGFNNGSIDLETGGTDPLDFYWLTTSDSGSIVENLLPGAYSVFLRDGEECHDSLSFIIEEPDSLSIDLEVEHTRCYGDATGKIKVLADGGTEPYDIDWSNGQSGMNLEELSAGIYSVTVLDANGCNKNREIHLTQPLELELLYDVSHPANELSFDGTIAIESITGGNPPYTVAWANSDTTLIRTGLSPGNFSVTVTDATGCSEVVEILLVAQHTLGDEVLIEIWPNPINRLKLLHVKVASPIGFVLTADMYDVLGRKLNNGPSNETIIPGSQVFQYPLDLPYGMYFIRFKDRNTDLGLFKLAVVSH